MSGTSLTSYSQYLKASMAIGLVCLAMGCGQPDETYGENSGHGMAYVRTSGQEKPSGPGTVEVPDQLRTDWNQRHVGDKPVVAPAPAPLPPQPSATPSGLAPSSQADKSLFFPDISHRSVWVHLFPVFAGYQGSYSETPPQHWGTVELEMKNGQTLNISNLQTGERIAVGRKVKVKTSSVTVDGKVIGHSGVFISPSQNGLTKVCWQDQQECREYRGSFVAQPLNCQASDGCKDALKSQSKISKNIPFLRFVNVVDLEDYLMSVVASEMGTETNEENAFFKMSAMRAQALASRSFATYYMILNRRNITENQSRFLPNSDVVATTAKQQYWGAKLETSRSVRAVRETNEQLLKYNFGGGRFAVIEASYHSNSGGQTRAWTDIDGCAPDHPYLVSAKEPYSKELRHLKGGTRFVEQSSKDLMNALKKLDVTFSDKVITKVEVVHVNSSGGVTELKVSGAKSGVNLKGANFDDFIRAIGIWRGGNDSKDDYFDVSIEKGKFKFSIYGDSTHRLGLSQRGAGLLSQHGWKTEEITGLYYRNVQIANPLQISPF